MLLTFVTERVNYGYYVIGLLLIIDILSVRSSDRASRMRAKRAAKRRSVQSRKVEKKEKDKERQREKERRISAG